MTIASLPTNDAADALHLRIARLEGQVASLEAALERRSGQVRLLQRYLCARDLAQWSRIEAGLLPLPRLAHEPLFWEETRELTAADVPDTLEILWESLFPPGLGALAPSTGVAAAPLPPDPR